MKALYGDEAYSNWSKLNKKIIAVTKGWTDAYYNFFMSGEADIVLSYTSSPAAHIMFEDNYDISASTFEEGNYISVEFAGILKSSKNKDMANNFLNSMISDDFQSVIPSISAIERNKIRASVCTCFQGRLVADKPWGMGVDMHPKSWHCQN